MRTFLSFKGSIVLFSATLLALACKPPEPARQSQTKNLAADPNARNYALVFTGSDDGIPGVDRDAQNIAATFGPESGLGLNFIVKRVEHATTAQILQESANVAAQMARESPNGTLAFYISTHGADDGAIISSDGCLYFEEIARAMRAARNDQPLQRLIVMIDTCFAGQSVSGSHAINRSSGSQAITCDGSLGGLPQGVQRMLGGGMALTGKSSPSSIIPSRRLRDFSRAKSTLPENPTREQKARAILGQTLIDDVKTVNSAVRRTRSAPNSGSLRSTPSMQLDQPTSASGSAPFTTSGLYVEYIGMAASLPRQEANDMGMGGMFTLALTQALKELRASRGDSATVSDLFNQIPADMRELTGFGFGDEQTPVFNSDLPQGGNEELFARDVSSTVLAKSPSPASSTASGQEGLSANNASARRSGGSDVLDPTRNQAANQTTIPVNPNPAIDQRIQPGYPQAAQPGADGLLALLARLAEYYGDGDSPGYSLDGEIE